MGRVAVGMTAKDLQRVPPEPDKRAALDMLHLGVQRRRNIAKHLPVHDDRATKVRLVADQRARGELIGRLPLLQTDVALRLRQHRIAFGVEVDLRPTVLLDHQPIKVDVAVGIAAIGCAACAQLRHRRAEPWPEDNVHHLLVGAVAIFQRDFFGQDLDPLDRFGRNVPHLAEARNTLTIKQQHRAAARASLAAPNLRRDGIQQFIDVACAGRPGHRERRACSPAGYRR